LLGTAAGDSMKINLEGPQYYSGLGDLVMWAWLAAGSLLGTDPLVFYRTRNLDLAEMLGLTVTSQPGGRDLDEAFRLEVADRGRLARVEYIRRFLGITTPLIRPACRADENARSAAEKIIKEVGEPLVMLFPQVAWRTREWPANYWVDLAWKLKDHGVGTIIALHERDQRFENTPYFIWGYDYQSLAALIRKAAVVVGNDSFPVHFAGTLGVPSVALMGPTRATVFAHIPEVLCISSSGLDCTGCHFGAPFRPACDQGCMSLYRLFPDDLLRVVLARIKCVQHG
jgi:hypothetical protein